MKQIKTTIVVKNNYRSVRVKVDPGGRSRLCGAEGQMGGQHRWAAYIRQSIDRWAAANKGVQPYPSQGASRHPQRSPNAYSTLQPLKYFWINHGHKRVFSIRNHHKCFSQLFPLHLSTYVMGLRPIEIFVLLQCGKENIFLECWDRLYRRQILTFKDVPAV